jgi:hypothetical protein
MVLTASELTSKGIVHGGVGVGERPTTYDATVGSIIRCGVEVQDLNFVLRPRQIVWVVSAETFDMGNSTTGLATLKTQWTHQGVLALNVGIVDPGWNGPLAAAVVNFSSSDFVIERGTPFFRILFHKHKAILAAELRPLTFSRDEYVRQIIGHSKSFATTFLDMDDLSRSVADKVFGLPRWGLILSFIAVVIGLLAISIPVGVSILMDTSGDKSKIAVLDKKISDLEARISPLPQIDPAKCRHVKLGGKIKLLCPAQP